MKRDIQEKMRGFSGPQMASVALAIFLGASNLYADEKIWSWGPATKDRSGDWFGRENWQPVGAGLPNEGSVVEIANGGTAEIGRGAVAYAKRLTLGQSDGPLTGRVLVGGQTAKLAAGAVQINENSSFEIQDGAVATGILTVGYALTSLDKPSILGKAEVLVSGQTAKLAAVAVQMNENSSLEIQDGAVATGILTVGHAPSSLDKPAILGKAEVLMSGQTAKLAAGFVQLNENGTLQIRDGATVFAETIAIQSATDAQRFSSGQISIGTGGLGGRLTADTIRNDGNITFDLTDTTTLDAVISGSGTITKEGTGTAIIIGNNNRFLGETTIRAGTLQFGNGGRSGTVAGNVFDEGFLVFDRSDSITFSGVIRGKGALVKLGDGSLTLSGSNTYSGATLVSAGALRAGSANAFGNNSAVAVNSELDLNGYSNSIGSLSGNGAVTNGEYYKLPTLTVGSLNTNTTFSGSLSGLNVAKVGTGTLTLSGNNDYAGLLISAGTVGVNNDNNVGSRVVIFDGGALRATGSFTTNRPMSVDGGNGTILVANGQTLTINGTITGNLLSGGGLTFGDGTNGGTTVLNGNTGPLLGFTEVNAGKLVVNATLTSPNPVNVASGSTLGGTGAIMGPLTISSGGALSPGNSLGTLTVGSLTLNSDSILNYQLGTPNVVGNGANDLVQVNGSLTLAGKLNISDAGGFGEGVYRLFNYTGRLANNDLRLGTLPPSFVPAWFLVQTSQGGQVNLIVARGGFQNQFWDGSVVGGDGTFHGGSGTWNNAGTNWTSADFKVNAPWQNGFAIFGGKAGSVTLGDNIPFGGMQFMTDGYVINPAGAQKLIAAADTTIRVNQNVTATISAPIVDANASTQSAITKTDQGTLILSGNNSYSGGTTISAGTLQLGNGGTSGTIIGNVTDNGILAFNRSDSVTFEGKISGTGVVQQIGTGTTILGASNSYIGGTTINAGTLQLGSGGTSGSLAGDIENNGTLAVNRRDTIILSGHISGSGKFTQNGTGITILAGNNTYTGGTAVSAGTLQIGNGGTSGGITGNVTDNSSLVFNRSDTLTFGGAISGPGNLQQNGAGTTVLTDSNTYAGGTTINAGALQLGNGGTTGSIIGKVINNGTVAFNRSDSVTFSGMISGTGNLEQLGSGTLTLTGNNTYSGPTLVTSGTLVAASNTAFGTGVVTVDALNHPSTLLINSGITLTNGFVVNNGAMLDNAGTINHAGSTAGTASILNRATGHIGSGGVVFSGAEGTLINAGAIQGRVLFRDFANTAQLFTGGTIAGDLNLGSNTGTKLILDGSGRQLLSEAVTGNVTNSGSLVKQGTGSWTVDKALNAPISTNVLAGVLTVNSSLNSPFVTVQSGGTLSGSGNISGSVTNFGSISAGNSPGTLTINGDYTQAPSGVFNVEIASATNYDRLVVTGHANLDGTLRLTLLSGYRPLPTDHFTILTAGKGISGAFRTIIRPDGVPFQVIYGQNGVVQLTSDPPKQTAPKLEFHLSDGTPNSTTALLASHTFNGFGSLAGRQAESSKNSSIGITFDAGEFDIQGQHGETYGFPIAGQFKINDRARLEYEIPLQYLELPGSNILQAGLTLSVPIKAIIASQVRPWSWTVTPTAAFASSGGKELIGGGALTNVVSCRWRDTTLTYGSYISFFEGCTMTSNDAKFATGVSQQIMKNGLRVSIPFAKSWLFEAYGIYTNFFQSALVSSYYTVGTEVGRHITWERGGQPIDLGYYSVGLYTEQGDRYSSGHFQFGSAWRF